MVSIDLVCGCEPGGATMLRSAIFGLTCTYVSPDYLSLHSVPPISLNASKQIRLCSLAVSSSNLSHVVLGLVAAPSLAVGHSSSPFIFFTRSFSPCFATNHDATAYYRTYDTRSVRFPSSSSICLQSKSPIAHSATLHKPGWVQNR